MQVTRGLAILYSYSYCYNYCYCCSCCCCYYYYYYFNCCCCCYCYYASTLQRGASTTRLSHVSSGAKRIAT